MGDFDISAFFQNFEMDGFMYFFLILFAFGPLRIVYRYIVRIFKGSINIDLPQKNYNYGDTIVGNFTLVTKKRIECEDLSVHLICFKREKTYSNNSSTTRWVELTRISQNIEGIKNLDGGIHRNYEINLKIPMKNKIFWQENFTEENLGALGNDFLSTTAKFMFHSLKNQTFKWKLSVILEARGADISATKKMSIQDK